jgi:myo-inositol-1(or 4)-monophosphatase
MAIETSDPILARIARALEQAAGILRRYTPGAVAADEKAPGDPVTEADCAVDAVLRSLLPRDDEGWLSEETADDLVRLERRRVWIVDPLDGTREFVAGIPEWCVSVGYVEEGRAVAGGICNPATRETILGSRDGGVLYNGGPATLSGRSDLTGGLVLASRSEVRRGQWDHYRNAPFSVRPMGSVAYKLGLVAAGRADATWTLAPKHEWDVAAGVALVLAAGGQVHLPGGKKLRFNREKPLLDGLAAYPPALEASVRRQLSDPF